MDAREQIIRKLLGQNVHVVIDRPIGYRHGDIVYPINYGYIPDVIAGDGEAQDAYILGVDSPLSVFDGRVIGVIRRLDDCEDKLIIAPDGMCFHQGEIAEAVHFQEQYFNTTIDSLLHKSCGVIPYRHTATGKEFLIVLQSNNCWSFPKGHMEAGETETETALRELAEETGLQADLNSDARLVLEYPTSPITHKQVVLFFGEVRGSLTLRKGEIYSHRWVTYRKLKDFLPPDTVAECAKLEALLK